MNRLNPYKVFWLWAKRTNETKKDFAKKLQALSAGRLGKKSPLWIFFKDVPKKGEFFKEHFCNFEKMKLAKKIFPESFFITDKQMELGLYAPTKKQAESWEGI